RQSSSLTAVRETENQAEALTNKPLNDKQYPTYQREKYRRFEAKICNSGNRTAMLFDQKARRFCFIINVSDYLLTKYRTFRE
ncbi:MAG: hypothetical protein FWE68_04945, partial [Defluviitaleaceae bacterium]|nr:hypothetical protein [Defluviitaleaceae bacterium]